MSNTLWIAAGILGVISVAIFFILAFDIRVQPVQMTIAAGIFLVIILAVLTTRFANTESITGIFRSEGRDYSRDMEKAMRTARKFWRVMRHGEELSVDEAHGVERTFKKDRVFGLLFYRDVHRSGKGGTPVTMVIRSNPMRVVHWDDHPRPELQDNPFLDWSAGYTGVPVEGLTPGEDASFYRGGAPTKSGPLVTIGGDVDRFLRGEKDED